MKKLMIAAAIVCAAAMSQAATISWSLNPYKLTDATGAAITSADNLVLVYMSTADDWANATALDIKAKAVTGETSTTLTVSSRAGSEGQVSGKVTVAFSSGEPVGGIQNEYYLALMYKDENGDLQKLLYTSGDDKGKEMGAVAQITKLTGSSASETLVLNATGNFTAESVPEPTSAMLLLLGVAGLALRRRRA